MPTTITREALYRGLKASAGLVLVEALGAPYYADAHLPGAINIPPDQIDRLAPSLLPERGAEIVVYCSGTCHNAEVAARRLEELGYQRIRIYAGGKEEWVEHGLPVERQDEPG